jgi:hypothetical protein
MFIFYLTKINLNNLVVTYIFKMQYLFLISSQQNDSNNFKNIHILYKILTLHCYKVLNHVKSFFFFNLAYLAKSIINILCNIYSKKSLN